MKLAKNKRGYLVYRIIKGIFVLTLLFCTAVFSQYPNDVPNRYILSKDVYDRDIDKYIGIKYIFYNILVYDNESYIPPYPYNRCTASAANFDRSLSSAVSVI